MTTIATAPKTKLAASDVPLLKVLERAIAVAVDFEKFGNHRKADMASMTVDADKSVLALTKTLLQAPELKAIEQIDREAREYLNRMGLPSFFKPGIYLIPLTLIDAVDGKLHEFAKLRGAKVDAFLAAYPTRVNSMREVLRELFNPDDYPDVDEVREMFTFRWRYLELGVPSRLASISSEVYRAANARASKEVAGIVESLRAVPRAAMQQLVSHLVDRLTPEPGGKPKKFKTSTIDKLSEFLTLFEHRDLTGDGELKGLVQQARGILKGVDASILRDDDQARAAIAQQMSTIATALDGMVASAGRQIRMED